MVPSLLLHFFLTHPVFYHFSNSYALAKSAGGGHLIENIENIRLAQNINCNNENGNSKSQINDNKNG